MNAKEMIYGTERIVDVLDAGKCFGYQYYILNLGTHPTAYVEIPSTHYCYQKQYDNIDINVHGGLTYSEKSLWIGKHGQIQESWFIGWDYAHYGDYVGLHIFSDEHQKKWTTKEIQKDVFSVCEQLKEMEKNDVKNS